MTRITFKYVCLLFFVFFLGWMPSVQAQSTDSDYIVTGVEVDTLAESAVKARNKAFSEAQVKAFKMLAARFVEASALEGLSVPDSKVLSGMVQDFEVTGEQFSRKRYKGSYTFRFREGAVWRYFGHGPLGGSGQAAEGIDVSTSTRSKLVLPVYQTESGQTVLWDSAKNPWLQVWRDRGEGDGFFVPLGDVSDVMDVPDDQALTYNPAAMNRLRARYEVQDVFILVARMTPETANPMELKFYRAGQDVAELRQTISVPAGSAQTEKDLMHSAANLAAGMIAKGVTSQDAPAVEENGVENAEATVAAALPGVAPQPYTPTTGTARVHIRFSGVQEWMAIRRQLNGLPALVAVRIVGLRPQDADVDLVYLDWAGLVSGLSGRGLALSEQSQSPGIYDLIRRASGLTYTP